MDISGDGCPDYLVKAPDQIIVVGGDDDDDVGFSIPVPSVNHPVLLLSSGSCSNFVSQSPTIAQSNDTRWTPANYAVLKGDVVGDGSGSILLVPTTAASNTVFNLTRTAPTASFALLQTISAQSFGIGSSAAISLELANADARSDRVIRNGSQVAAVFSAGTDGKFASGGSDLVALATVVWGNFASALAVGKVDSALQMISSTSLPVFQTQLGSSQAAQNQFAQRIVSFDVTDISSPGVIQAALVLNVSGVNNLFYVMFEIDSDGYWKIYSM